MNASPRERLDARTQAGAALRLRREEVIHLHEEGIPVMQIVKRSGLSWSAVNAAIKAYRRGGHAALEPQTRGRKPGMATKLTKQQEVELRQLIRYRRPSHYGLKSLLWTREAVVRVTEQRLGVKLTAATMGKYLQRWGIAVQRRNMPPSERCSPEVRGWVKSNYAAMLSKAQADRAEIYWMNKTVALDLDTWAFWHVAAIQEFDEGEGGGAESAELIDDDDNADSQVWAEADENWDSADYQVDDLPIQSRRVMQHYFVSAVNNQGRLNWIILNCKFGPQQQIKFIKALSWGKRTNNLIIIKNDSKQFSSRDVMGWLKEKKYNVKVYPDDEQFEA